MTVTDIRHTWRDGDSDRHGIRTAHRDHRDIGLRQRRHKASRREAHVIVIVDVRNKNTTRRQQTILDTDIDIDSEADCTSASTPTPRTKDRLHTVMLHRATNKHSALHKTGKCLWRATSRRVLVRQQWYISFNLEKAVLLA